MKTYIFKIYWGNENSTTFTIDSQTDKAAWNEVRLFIGTNGIPQLISKQNKGQPNEN